MLIANGEKSRGSRCPRLLFSEGEALQIYIMVLEAWQEPTLYEAEPTSPNLLPLPKNMEPRN